jgi:hypothetical protein
VTMVREGNAEVPGQDPRNVARCQFHTQRQRAVRDDYRDDVLMKEREIGLPKIGMPIRYLRVRLSLI